LQTFPSTVWLIHRYDLGSGAALIRSTDKLSLNGVHTVLARRFRRDGILRVDSAPAVSGRSPGLLRALNVLTPLYLGHVPNATARYLHRQTDRRTDRGLQRERERERETDKQTDSVDYEPTGHSPGLLRALNVLTPFYLGHLPNATARSVKTTTNLNNMSRQCRHIPRPSAHRRASLTLT